MKTVTTLLVILLSAQITFAGGVTGTGPQKEFNSRINDVLSDSAKDIFSEKAAGQVYYMRKKQAEIEFATNKAGDDKIEIQSLRPEEISNPAVLEGLKRSQQSKQWENIKLPSKIDMNRIILNSNKLGGMQVR